VVEVEFCSIYSDQPYFSDIEQFLRKKGFSFYGFCDQQHRSCKNLDKRKYIGKERLVWANAIFFRDPYDHERDNACSVVDERQEKSLILSAILLEYMDFAIEIVEKSNMPIKEKEVLRELICLCGLKESDKERAKLDELLEQIAEDPTNTNVHIGKYIDSKRWYPDFNEFGGMLSG